MTKITEETKIIAAAALFVGVATMFLNVSPILTGVMAETFGFSNKQLGQLMGIPLIASAITCASQILWIRRMPNWRLALFTFALLLMITFILSVFLTSYTLFLWCFFLLGLFGGGIYGTAMTLIGDSHNPDRGFGGAQLAQSFVALPLIFVIPAVIEPTFGFGGVMLAMGAFPLLCLFAAQLIPVQGLRANDRELTREHLRSTSSIEPAVVRKPRIKSSSLFALIAIALFLQGWTGLYVFLERIGSEVGLSGFFIGTVLTISGVFGAAATLVPITCGVRYGRVLPAAVGTSLFVLGTWLLGTRGEASFVAGNIFLGISYAIAAPYLFGQLSSTDSDGTFTAAMPAIILAASGSGPIVAGWLYTKDFAPILLFASAAILIAQMSMYLSKAAKMRGTE